MDYGPELKPADGQRVKMEDGHDYEWREASQKWVDAPGPDNDETPRLVCDTDNCPGDPPNRNSDGLLRHNLNSDKLERWSAENERWEATTG